MVQRFWIYVAFLAGVVPISMGQALAQQDEPIIVDSDFGDMATIAERSFIGYRKLPEGIFVKNVEGGEIGFDSEIVARALNDDPDFVKTEVYNLYYKDKNIEEIIGTLSEHEASITTSRKSRNLEQLKSAHNIAVSGAESEYVDADFVRALTGTELFKNAGLEKVVNPTFGANDSAIQVNQDVAYTIRNTYLQVLSAKGMQPADASTMVYAVGNSIDKYPLLKAAAELKFGIITFGEPITYLSSEKALEIPNSLSRHFDVYWIEFAFSIRDIVASDYEEISFNVKLPKDSRALELVPLSYVVEEIVEDEVQSPELGVKVGGVVVKVGKVFSRQVAFRRLKPIIFATGLQENAFSWTIKGQAIENGSRRFIAIVGVPKGTVSVPIEFSASARLSGNLLVQGGIATSRPVSRKIVF